MGLFSSGSAKRAAALQERAMKKAGKEYRQTWYDDFAPMYNPYIDAGTSALSQYQDITRGLPERSEELYDISRSMDPIVERIRSDDMDAYKDTPGYRFRMEEGQKALERSAAARGNLFSGATGKALTRYGQDFGTSEYDNYINRLRNQLGDVQTQIGGRQSALSAQYQNLNALSPTMQLGYNATGAQVAGGTDAEKYYHDMNVGSAKAYASGMIAKSNQLQSLGGSIIQAGTTAIGGALGRPAGANIGSQIGSSFKPQLNQQEVSKHGYSMPQDRSAGYSMSPALNNVNMSSPWVNPNYVTMGNTDPSLPWLQGSSPQQQAALSFQSSYS